MTLRPINQAHIDYFVANVGTGNNALRAFVSWACANGHAFGIEVPINKRFSPAAAMSADGLWQAADLLGLHIHAVSRWADYARRDWAHYLMPEPTGRIEGSHLLIGV